MSFTRSEMVCYYVIATEHVCLHCCTVSATTVSQKIMVEYMDTHGKTGSLSLSALIDRYVRNSDARIDGDTAATRLPLLPFETRKYEQTVNFCINCLPKEFGGEGEDCFPTMLPAARPEIFGPIESENLPDPTTRTTKPTSKKIKRESPEERKRREALQAIRRGDISSLL